MTAAPTSPQPNGSTPLSPSSSTSVFNALGSYADRIRDKDMTDGLSPSTSAGGASSSKKSPKPSKSTELPNGTTSHPAAASSSSTSKPREAKSNAMPPPPPPKAAPAPRGRAVKEKEEKEPEKAQGQEDEGAWETVPAGKPRRKEKEGTASTNWRDRPKEKRDSSAWRNGDDEKVRGEGKKKGGQAAGASTTSARSTSTHAVPSSSSTSATPSTTARAASVTPASTTRKAWGIVTPSPTVPIAASPLASTSKPRVGTQTPPSAAPSKAVPTETPKSTPSARTTTPPSPSVNGASTAVNTSVTGSVASPNLSATAETASTATMVTPRGGLEEDEDWRIRPRKLSAEMSAVTPESETERAEVAEPEVKETRPAQAAPPPSTNAWAERRKAMGTTNQAQAAPAPNPSFPAASSSDSIASKTSTITPSPSVTTASKTAGPEKMLFGSVEISESKGMVNGASAGPAVGGTDGVKVAAPKKKKQAQGGQRHVVDTNAFPDLAQAVAQPKKVEKKEGKSEESSLVDDAGAPRKTKWTAIPATELLAAADEAKRHAQAVANRLKHQQQAQNQTSGQSRAPITTTSASAILSESSLSPKVPRKRSAEGKKGRAIRSGSNGAITLPPNPMRRGSGSTVGGTSVAGLGMGKPVFGSFRGMEGEEQATGLAPSGTVNGGSSAPMSRQSTSQGPSPQRSRTQLPSPSTEGADVGSTMASEIAALRMGAPSFNGAPGGMMGSTTAPMPQSGFPTSSGASAPRSVRPPRQSFSGGRGRGAYRGGFKSGMAGAMNPGTGEVYMSNGNGNGNGNGYQRGAGGYSTFVPQAGQIGASGQNGYEPNQGMYAVWDPVQGYAMPSGMYGTPGGAQRQTLPMPPPPMPVTQAAGLDALRFYVLGQVEYYFSMQNLAMDFFLRQQMDSEGWIDIAMISSFNRIKSLTPDVSIIKEMMAVSALLEVRDDKVRLSHGESKRWVLPDAKPSPFVDDGTGESAGTGEEGDGGLGLSVGWGSIPIENGQGNVMGLGMEDRTGFAQGVENALMKSSSSAPSVAAGAGAKAAESEGEGDEKEDGKDIKMDLEGGKDGEQEKSTVTSASSDTAAEQVELR